MQKQGARADQAQYAASPDTEVGGESGGGFLHVRVRHLELKGDGRLGVYCGLVRSSFLAAARWVELGSSELGHREDGAPHAEEEDGHLYVRDATRLREGKQSGQVGVG